MRLLRWLGRVTAFRIALWIGAGCAVLHFLYSTKGFEIPVVDRLDRILYDAKFILRGPYKDDSTRKHVVLAAGDDRTIQELGRFPWSREYDARLIDRLVADRAAAIGFDMAFADEDRSKGLPELRALREQARRVTAARSGEAAEIITALGRIPEDVDPDQVLARSLKAAGDRVVLGYIQYPVHALVKPPLDRIERGFELLHANTLSHVRKQVEVLPGGAVRHSVADEVPGRGVLDDVVPDPPVPVIAAATSRLGYFNVEPDFDGKIRRVPLVAWAGGDPVPSLDLATVAAALGVPTQWITPISDAAARPLLSSIEIEGKDGKNLSIPVQRDGSMFVDFHGPDGAFEAWSIADIIAGAFPPGTFKDRVVLVGMTAIGTHDQRVTPFETFSPGVEIHAAAIENILSGRMLSRPYWSVWMEFVLLLVFAIGLGLLFSRVDARIGFASYLIAAAGYFALDYGLFRSGTVIVSALPQVQLLFTFVSTTTYRYLTETREKRALRRAFQFYLDEAVMQEMLQAPEKLKLGGEKRELSVLFSDIRGFTTLSEQLAPEELVGILNEYLTPMTGIVFHHGGTLDKYMGDAIMAFFGAPVEQPDHAFRACVTALDMSAQLQRLHQKWRSEGKPELDIGVGINSGAMVVGNMGSDMRFDYTVMGDNVNLGSRLEGLNKEYGTRIVMSEFTYEAVKGRVAVRQLGAVRVKGKRHPVKIYELRGMGAPLEADRPFLESFAMGLEARWPGRDFSAAAAAFRQALSHSPHDVTSEKYLAECQAYEKDPPPDSWDGVAEMKTK